MIDLIFVLRFLKFFLSSFYYFSEYSIRKHSVMFKNDSIRLTEYDSPEAVSMKEVALICAYQLE